MQHCICCHAAKHSSCFAASPSLMPPFALCLERRKHATGRSHISSDSSIPRLAHPLCRNLHLCRLWHRPRLRFPGYEHQVQESKVNSIFSLPPNRMIPDTSPFSPSQTQFLSSFCNRYIKMSSPYLNNMIIIGCILTYTSVILLGLDSSLTSEANFPYICAVRADPRSL